MGARPCEQYLSACCVIVSVYIPVGYQLVDSLHLKSSKNYSWSDTCCDIRSYSVLECPKIPSRSFCVLLPKLEELHSWILKLGKAGLVVTKIGVRCLQTSLYEEQESPSVVWFICPNIDFFGRCVFCATVHTCSAYCSSFSGCKPVVQWAIFWCKNEDQSFFRLGDIRVRKLVRPDIDALLSIIIILLSKLI